MRNCAVCGKVLMTGYMLEGRDAEKHGKCAAIALTEFCERIKAIRWPSFAKQ